MSDQVTVELDIVNEDDEDFSGLRSRWPRVTFDVITEHGPGGGWPVVNVSGDREDVREWLASEYVSSGESVNDYLK